jgi:hypothetical protein
MEELLLRLVPDLDEHWRGATEDEIERVQEIAGRPLPRFYRWFLLRMGHSMGPISYPSLDFSVAKVLASYTEDLFLPHRRFLMIAYESDDVMPLHLLYDLDHPVRDDALVTKRHANGGATYDRFETFREMLAWGKMLSRSIDTRAQHCRGTLYSISGNVKDDLDPVMSSLGFTTPIPTGPYCCLYEAREAAMVASNTPRDGADLLSFKLGGPSAGRLRRILGEIATETSIEVKSREWEPRLA